MIENKQAASAETRAALHEVLAAFEGFKAGNDERMAALEKRGAADVLIEEKVARIDAGLTAATARLERLGAEARRPVLGAAERKGGGVERDAGFDAYLRAGVEMKAGLAETAPSTGGYVAPPEIDRAIERRLHAASPMREICSVRTIGSSVFRKPTSITGVASGWVAETAARPETDPATLALLEFPAADLYANPAATQNLLDDAFVNLEEWLATEVEDAFATQETEAFTTGNGTNKPKGFLSYDIVAEASHAWDKIGYLATGVAGGFAASNPTDKLLDLIYTPKAKYRPGGRFVMGRGR